MDSFDLRWPKTNATLHTDGWRLKIVVRDKRGPSGTIDNNELCKQRVANGLSFAPKLLSQLKAKGHGTLADDIEKLAASIPEARPARDVVGEWLDKLPGSDEWESCGTKRARSWHAISDVYELKPPAKRGKKEWVLRTSNPDGKTGYLAAADFKGICTSLRDNEVDFFESFLGACAALADASDDVSAAIEAWGKR